MEGRAEEERREGPEKKRESGLRVYLGGAP